MNKLTLYTHPMSRGRIARWMMEELGQPYDTVLLDYGTTMKAPEYLRLNPMGKVPTVTHGDRVITECAAICTYLADAFPQAGLMPADRAAFYRWMFFGAGPLEAAVVNRSLGVEITAEQKGRVGYGCFDDVVAALKGQLAQHDFIAGPAFSAADVYVGSQIGWGLQFGTLPAEPEFAAYAARLRDRPAARRASQIDDAARGTP
ncbi:glutathione S-transferase family protein [Gemmobacter caeruleus]|uniref:glutathione S-transferase family protein n=1 Tax=Gemmobacter caeruleus TaxID=2595004 RepID=UPI0011EFA6F2|nr:glutathione S-transferase family protein [Gemmobacter caeruleus]